ncbi:sensor histidine kinase [Sphingomicrobium flavum]|uniref:sensor histidine kinase n=1 Tax=Sphingomicrobium flavum TaxID=1229164 RepID=UPI0021ADBD32|nr:PAS domain-containing sensor histidine kinase [Sphingomicrobium flavum]
MVELTPTVSAAIIVIAALWIGVAAILLVIAGRRISRANRVLGSARSLVKLLGAAPARPLLVEADGRIEPDQALLHDLGLGAAPTSLAALATESGLSEEDAAKLEQAVDAALLSGDPVDLQLTFHDASRVFEVRGGMADDPDHERSVLLWFFDATRAEEQRQRLSRRLGQTENALDSLTQLIENAPFPMWYRGPDLSLGLVNAAFVAAVEGNDAADVIKRGSELIEGTGGQDAKVGASKAIEQGKPYSRTQPATIGGERRMLKLVDVPLQDGAVAGFAIDIQDLEDARVELARHIQSQRELADRMTAGTAQFDVERRLDFYNQPFAIMTQLEPELLDERPRLERLLEAMREKGRVPETRDFPEWKNQRRDWFTSAEEAIEEDWILANGDHLRVVGQPLPDGGLRLILEDRTEQVRLASARDTLLRVRSATFDNLFEAIAVFASDGRLYLWNRRFCETWGLDESWLSEHPRVDELVPAMARALVNPTDAAQLRELVRSATSGRKEGQGEISFNDGRHFAFAAVPLPDGNALFTMVDVTDSNRIQAALRERAQALEETDKVKTNFVENMSYELRTPLTSIGGFAEMLSEGYAGRLEPSAKEYVEAIIESVGRLSRLIDNVLDLTRTEGGALELERERIDVAGLVKSVSGNLSRRAEEKGQKVELELGEDAGVLMGDAKRLREAIEHVLRNAIDYSDPDGAITVNAGGNDEHAIITISDTGPGISEEELPRVFDRFHKTEGRRGESALGLGLPLTRQFVEAHGGRVELASSKGKGTAVTIVLPRGQ